MAVKLPYLKTVKRPNGKTEYYYQRGGELAKIEGDPRNWAAFSRAYEAAEAQVMGTAEAERQPESQFRTLISAYRSMGAFRDLASRTQTEYDAQLRKIDAAWGDWPIEACEDERWVGDLIKWHDTLAQHAPCQADRCADVLKTMLKRCVKARLIKVNHALEIDDAYHADRVEKIWSPEQIAAFMERAPRELQWVMMLALHTGQRRADLISMAWSNYDGAALRVRVSKTGRGAARRGTVTVNIPCTPELRDMLDGMPRRASTILTTVSGLPWTGVNLDARWRIVVRAAGIEDRTIHDLRRTTITTLSDHGATPQEIASITGHAITSVHDIIMTYSGRTRKQAMNGVAKLQGSWIGGLQVVTGTAIGTGCKDELDNQKKIRKINAERC
jgi:integrase